MTKHAQWELECVDAVRREWDAMSGQGLTRGRQLVDVTLVGASPEVTLVVRIYDEKRGYHREHRFDLWGDLPRTANGERLPPDFLAGLLLTNLFEPG